MKQKVEINQVGVPLKPFPRKTLILPVPFLPATRFPHNLSYLLVILLFVVAFDTRFYWLLIFCAFLIPISMLISNVDISTGLTILEINLLRRKMKNRHKDTFEFKNQNRFFEPDYEFETLKDEEDSLC